VKRRLHALMDEASLKQDYERAASFRDRLTALSHIQSRQGINPHSVKEADVFAAHQEAGQTCIQVFIFRTGNNWGNRAYFPRADKSLLVEEVLESFVAPFYDDKPPPKLVLLSHDIGGRKLLTEALSLRAGRKIEVGRPVRGERRDLVEHALVNAREALARRLADSTSQAAIFSSLAELLDLDEAPERIEVYDNSHISGTNPVGAMIVAGPEGFIRAQYRKFNMRNEDLAPGDDYAMMREMLTRRFSRLAQEKGEVNGWAAPDLVLIDGGPGQLGAAYEVLDELGLSEIKIAAVAKGPDRNAGRERSYLKGKGPLLLEPRDPVLYCIQKLRDEAHRFASGAHRAKRKKAITASPLDEVPGIGPARKRALLQHFGSAKAVSRAGIADLQAVGGISAQMAKTIYDHFHGGATVSGQDMAEQGLKARRRPRDQRRGKFVSLPNLLTYFRILAIPALVACFFVAADWGRWTAMWIFIAAGVSDFLDGYLARAWEQQSVIGRMLDPIADKLIVAAALLMLAADQTIAGWSLWAGVIILCREMLVSGLREF